MPKSEKKQIGLLDTWGRRNRLHEDKECPECGATFKPRRASSKYCSRQCRWVNNGKNQKTVTESWWIDGKGYKGGFVRIKGKKVRKRYHRWLIEQLLGLELPPNIVVHHVNGDKLDNRIENLKVMGFGAHTKHHSAIRKARGE